MRTRNGFTLLEMVATIAILGVIATVSVIGVGEVVQNTRVQKLETEIKTLNTAVAVYQGFGGQISDDASLDDVIAKMKTVTRSSMSYRVPGLSGSMVDARLSYEVQSEEEASSRAPRVVWNGTRGKFEIARTGEAGIKSFGLEADPEAVRITESDRLFAMQYSAESTWVWDYQDRQAPVRDGPSSVTVETPGTIAGATPPEPGTPTGPSVDPGALAPPEFTRDGGNYSVRDFDLDVELVNPNPAGSSSLYYSVNYGPWQRYRGGSLDVSPDDVVRGQAISTDPDFWSNSALASATYNVVPVQLLPPLIETSASRFGIWEDRYITVSMDDPNVDDPSYIEFSVAGGPWQVYDAPFYLDRDDYSTSVPIVARTVSDQPYFESSEIATRVLDNTPFDIGGRATGQFHSPTGADGLVWNQDATDHFAWGEDGTYSWLSQSELEFFGSTTSSATLGSRFQLGTLDYYNGAILSGTGADSVTFDLGLALNLGGGVNFSRTFRFEFDLINVLNVGDQFGTGPDAWASADYVRIDDGTQTTQFSVNGTILELQLEFGDATDAGFADFSEFYVLENREATTNVYGTVRVISEQEGPPGNAYGYGKGKGKGGLTTWHPSEQV